MTCDMLETRLRAFPHSPFFHSPGVLSDEAGYRLQITSKSTSKANKTNKSTINKQNKQTSKAKQTTNKRQTKTNDKTGKRQSVSKRQNKRMTINNKYKRSNKKQTARPPRKLGGLSVCIYYFYYIVAIAIACL